MSRSLSILVTASLAGALGACSASRAPGLSPETLESRACAPELGADTGGELERAGLVKFGAIDGCLSDRHDVDGFLVHVDEDTPLRVELKSLDDHGAISLEVFDVDGGKLGFDTAASFETRQLRLQVPAETDVIVRIESRARGAESQGRYQLVIEPDRSVANK